MPTTYEACVTSVAQARAAQNAGADRLELCTRISTGGLTPPLPLLVAVRAAVAVPIHVMIRPRPGDFVHTRSEMDTMIRAIAAAREAGADGVVLGLLTADRQVDIVVLRALAPVTRGLSVTFHRAFDEVANPLEAMEELIMLGVSRILTSGGAPTARKGETVLANLVSASRGRIGIIACGKVRPANVRALIAATGVSEVHAHLKTAQAMRAMAGVVKGKARREK
jgi:copper homeostasis protein